jgi:hypothetical protein
MVERKHRHISEMGHTLMIASSVPLSFWAERSYLLHFCVFDKQVAYAFLL